MSTLAEIPTDIRETAERIMVEIGLPSRHPDDVAVIAKALLAERRAATELARARTRTVSGALCEQLMRRHPWTDWPDARKALTVAARVVTKGYLAPPAKAQAPVIREIKVGNDGDA